jgi:hypothetical protein
MNTKCDCLFFPTGGQCFVYGEERIEMYSFDWNTIDKILFTVTGVHMVIKN